MSRQDDLASAGVAIFLLVCAAAVLTAGWAVWRTVEADATGETMRAEPPR